MTALPARGIGHFRPLRPDGSPIEGLYVSGTPVAGLEGG